MEKLTESVYLCWDWGSVGVPLCSFRNRCKVGTCVLLLEVGIECFGKCPELPGEVGQNVSS